MVPAAVLFAFIERSGGRSEQNNTGHSCWRGTETAAVERLHSAGPFVSIVPLEHCC